MQILKQLARRNGEYAIGLGLSGTVRFHRERQALAWEEKCSYSQPLCSSLTPGPVTLLNLPRTLHGQERKEESLSCPKHALNM